MPSFLRVVAFPHRTRGPLAWRHCAASRHRGTLPLWTKRVNFPYAEAIVSRSRSGVRSGNDLSSRPRQDADRPGTEAPGGTVHHGDPPLAGG